MMEYIVLTVRGFIRVIEVNLLGIIVLMLIIFGSLITLRYATGDKTSTRKLIKKIKEEIKLVHEN